MDHKKIFKTYVRDLVDELAVKEADGYQLFFKALPEDVKEKLLILYFEYTGRNVGDILESLGGNEKWNVDNNFICDLIGLLHNNNDETRSKLTATMVRNMQDFWANTIQAYIFTACGDKGYEEKQLGGYRG